ncbi:uncharacterized protein MELLADRAFT_60066 [Melampsora larici-populina 98AG31]|uniref:Uncharacterized protein n=1 Tax=Melampsora larici-populina (strain 98AG31 / pathotype 3-4-7) TaxID=747676 RepID=F4R8M3_MELLP|nr:uncharacterized protein MELLADRAFT_60066 [Melampsora larici-populina 98AG31]EGG11088.1 hypothetical protein MELLADRAFT_60066 [Melampsora larici-populina 98AG31]
MQRSKSPLNHLPEDMQRSSSPLTELSEELQCFFEPPSLPFVDTSEISSKPNPSIEVAVKKRSNIDGSIQQNLKQRRIDFVPAIFAPPTPAQDFTPAQTLIQQKMAFEYVRKSIRDAFVVHLDYDVAVARFLQETAHLKLGDIPHSVDFVLAKSEREGRSTSLQNNAYVCARYIKEGLVAYDSGAEQKRPFALRYPNLNALKALAIKNSASARSMPSDVPVILLDIAGRMLAVGLPPKRQKTPAHEDGARGDLRNAKNSAVQVAKVGIVDNAEGGAAGDPGTAKDGTKNPTMDRAERALLACLGSARVYNLPIVDQELVDKAPPVNSSGLTPFPLTMTSGSRLSQITSQVAPHLGAIHGTVQYQSFGYGLGAPNSSDMADKQLTFGPERQGSLEVDAAWRKRTVDRVNLPQIIQQSGGPLYKRREDARVTIELGWQYDVSLAVIMAVQPEAYRIAHENIDLLSTDGDVLVQQRISHMRHRILCNRQITYNMQCNYHRDGKNSNLLDSVFFLGEGYKGARFVLADLGVTLCGDHGYSVHGMFKVLVHSVTHIHPDPDRNQPPQRISLAIYNHADAYAGIARYAAAHDQSGLFSKVSLWLPFSPGNFSVSDSVKILRDAGKAIGKEYEEMK